MCCSGLALLLLSGLMFMSSNMTWKRRRFFLYRKINVIFNHPHPVIDNLRRYYQKHNCRCCVLKLCVCVQDIENLEIIGNETPNLSPTSLDYETSVLYDAGKKISSGLVC